MWLLAGPLTTVVTHNVEKEQTQVLLQASKKAKGVTLLLDAWHTPQVGMSGMEAGFKTGAHKLLARFAASILSYCCSQRFLLPMPQDR
jgi:hypothetical protein